MKKIIKSMGEKCKISVRNIRTGIIEPILAVSNKKAIRVKIERAKNFGNAAVYSKSALQPSKKSGFESIHFVV